MDWLMDGWKGNMERERERERERARERSREKDRQTDRLTEIEKGINISRRNMPE